jgi:hypothetical protein
MSEEPLSSDAGVEEERREFLKRCGRFAVVTPPAITMMLSVAAKPAHARSSGFPGVGWGVGGTPPGTPGQHPKGKF